MARAKRRAVARQTASSILNPTSVAKKLRDGLKTELKRLRINATVQVEAVPGTSLRRFYVVASSFRHMPYADRQNVVWNIGRLVLRPEELLVVSMIVTVTPAEMKEQAAYG